MKKKKKKKKRNSAFMQNNHLYMVSEPREVIAQWTALDTLHTDNKGHNNRDLNRLRYLSPGRRVHTTATQKTNETPANLVTLSSLARILGECWTIPRLLFCCCYKVEISSCTLIPLFMPGSVHSGSANWDDCWRTFPTSCERARFPDRFPHYA